MARALHMRTLAVALQTLRLLQDRALRVQFHCAAHFLFVEYVDGRQGMPCACRARPRHSKCLQTICAHLVPRPPEDVLAQASNAIEDAQIFALSGVQEDWH